MSSCVPLFVELCIMVEEISCGSTPGDVAIMHRQHIALPS